MARTPANPDNRLSIDLSALEHNLGAMRQVLPKGARVAGVVKADAYGHGMLPVARRLKAAGAEALAVAVAAEGAALRRGGVEGPILLLLGLRPAQAGEALRWNLTPICGDMETLRALDAAGRAAGRRVPCQLKVDTGMGRLGVAATEAPAVLEELAGLGGLELTGLVSHLATGGDPESEQAARQARAFAQLLAAARDKGWALPDSSLAASGGALVPPVAAQGPGSLARLGIVLYGGLPAPQAAGRAQLRPVMSFHSRLLAVRPAPAGTLVSYRATWRTERDTWLGVVPVGYADGYPRSLSNRGRMLVGGRLVPVRGRVCMNLTVLELGNEQPRPRPGDPVALLGRQGGQEIGPDQLADWAGTISYEITCSLGAANRRRYTQS